MHDKHTMTEEALWERQHGEPPRAFAAFTSYRDLPPRDRSIDKAWRQGRSPQPGGRRAAGRWWRWSRTWDWVSRAQAWDARQDRIAREQVAKDQVAARVRHARMAQAALQVLTVPSRATLEALQHPLVLSRLVDDAKATTQGFFRLVDMVVLAARAIPGLVDVERLALGMSRDVIEIEERRVDNSLGMRIAQDPEAVNLAIALLDRIVGTDVPDSQQKG